jgi:hypothetical protein
MRTAPSSSARQGALADFPTVRFPAALVSHYVHKGHNGMNENEIAKRIVRISHHGHKGHNGTDENWIAKHTSDAAFVANQF